MEMTDRELLEAIWHRLERAHVPLEVALWDTADIAVYLRRSHGTVRDRIIVQPSFPRPISIPPAERPRPLYLAREVIVWAESQQQPEPRHVVAAQSTDERRKSRKRWWEDR